MDSNGRTIPAVFCKDIFAEELQAEASNQTDTKFYTDTYAKKFGYSDWVCPDMGKTSITDKSSRNMQVWVYNCLKAQTFDPEFLPDQVCKTKAQSAKFAQGRTLYKSFTSTNFVPAQYHTE